MSQWDVPMLRCDDQQLEGSVRINAALGHEDTLRLPDDVPRLKRRLELAHEGLEFSG